MGLGGSWPNFGTKGVLKVATASLTQPMTATTGIYRDVFVRTDTGWRFAKRSLYIDQVELPR